MTLINNCDLWDFRLLPCCRWGLWASGMLHSLCW